MRPRATKVLAVPEPVKPGEEDGATWLYLFAHSRGKPRPEGEPAGLMAKPIPALLIPDDAITRAERALIRAAMAERQARIRYVEAGSDSQSLAAALSEAQLSMSHAANALASARAKRGE